jgi:hypothetical protein
MITASDFTGELETKVAQQLKSQRVGYLLGAGSSYLNGTGYPLAFELWDLIKGTISDTAKRADIQSKLDGRWRSKRHTLSPLGDSGARGIVHAQIASTGTAQRFRSSYRPARRPVRQGIQPELRPAHRTGSGTRTSTGDRRVLGG